MSCTSAMTPPPSKPDRFASRGGVECGRVGQEKGPATLLRPGPVAHFNGRISSDNEQRQDYGRRDPRARGERVSAPVSSTVTGGYDAPENWRAIEERLGISARVHVAASFPELDRSRFSRLESCDFVFAAESHICDAWWSDVAVAASLGKPVVLAHDTESETPDQVCAAGRVFSRRVQSPGEPWRLLALAKILVAHDMSREVDIDYSQMDGFFEFAEKLESPIEARLGLHLFGSIHNKTVCSLEPQATFPGLRYRADFAISNEGLERHINDPGSIARYFYHGPIRICVECDGHNFHERTKEQAARDKKRDRELTVAGWQVLRFAGSEIWRDPAGCAEQVADLVVAKGGKL